MMSQSGDVSPSSTSLASTTQYNHLQISSRTLTTLDPCVILMKQIISQHADKWKDDPQGIFSLAQGVVHWKPPPSVYDVLSTAIQENIISDNDDNNNIFIDGIRN